MSKVKNVTRRQAEMVLRRVRARFEQDLRESGNPMTLHEPGFHTDGWSISWEGYRGETEWPMVISEAQYLRKIDLPDEVFVEPVAAWCLGVYPA